jgi:hypothetical protein
MPLVERWERVWHSIREAQPRIPARVAIPSDHVAWAREEQATPFVKDDTATRLSWYVDAGNVFNKNNNALTLINSNNVFGNNGFSLSEMRVSTGIPLHWQAPVGPIVINVGRARIIDTDALIDSLESGHLGGASLDVFPQEPLPPDHRLWKTPNVILTPHTSGFRRGHWEEVVDLFGDNLDRWLRNEPLKFRVEPELGY